MFVWFPTSSLWAFDSKHIISIKRLGKFIFQLQILDIEFRNKVPDDMFQTLDLEHWPEVLIFFNSIPGTPFTEFDAPNTMSKNLI